jgi:hypothetical protein
VVVQDIFFSTVPKHKDTDGGSSWFAPLKPATAARVFQMTRVLSCSSIHSGFQIGIGTDPLLHDALNLRFEGLKKFYNIGCSSTYDHKSTLEYMYEYVRSAGSLPEIKT